ncbi:MAG: hypothetical protein ACE5FH_05775 [Candidatus Zixiibacteriota bacterium]
MEIGQIPKSIVVSSSQADLTRPEDGKAIKKTEAKNDEYLSTQRQIGNLADSVRSTYDIGDVRHQRVIEIKQTVEGKENAENARENDPKAKPGSQAVAAYFSDDAVLEKIATRLADTLLG